MGKFASPHIVVGLRVNYIMLFSFDVLRIVEGVKIQYNFWHFGRSAHRRGCEGTLHLERLYFAVPHSQSWV